MDLELQKVRKIMKLLKRLNTQNLCEHCGILTSSMKGFKHHINTLHEGKQYKSFSCGKVDSYLDNRCRHMPTHRKDRTSRIIT